MPLLLFPGKKGIADAPTLVGSSSSGVSTGFQGQISFSHTTTSATDKLVVVALTTIAGTAPTSMAVTFDGDGLTEVDSITSQVSKGQYAGIFELNSPAAKTATIVINPSGGATNHYIGGAALNVDGIVSGNGTWTTYKNNDSGTAADVQNDSSNVTVANGGLLVAGRTTHISGTITSYGGDLDTAHLESTANDAIRTVYSGSIASGTADFQTSQDMDNSADDTTFIFAALEAV